MLQDSEIARTNYCKYQRLTKSKEVHENYILYTSDMKVIIAAAYMPYLVKDMWGHLVNVVHLSEY